MAELEASPILSVQNLEVVYSGVILAVLFGREMLEYLPYVPIGQGIRVGVAILTYNGRIAFGVTGDFDTAPDVDVLARGIEHGMNALVKRAEGVAQSATKVG